jgi:hypothetical protein
MGGAVLPRLTHMTDFNFLQDVRKFAQPETYHHHHHHIIIIIIIIIIINCK